VSDSVTEYRDVTSADGVRLCVRVAGVAERPAIVFVHGFSQSHLSWERQFSGALARDFRLVAFDLRGHGWSDKPSDAASYREASRWADDVEAVLVTLGLRRVVLVGWTYGGHVICDYLATRGTETVAGINFVAAVIGDEDDFYGPDAALVGRTAKRDPATSTAALPVFLHACFAHQPPQDEFERMLVYNAMVPPGVRSRVLGRTLDARALLAALDVPVLFTHGSEDRIIAPAMSRFGAATVPGAQLSMYEGVGHSPFYEAAERFDRELAEFVRACPRE
jgi:non-heme chloroperoxidase